MIELSVIVENNQPLEYWAWSPGMDLEVGVWDTQIPAIRKAVSPEVMLISLLGFHLLGYRLGCGGGYFDRALLALKTKPISIAVGCECGRLDTIYTQTHDVPMDMVVTEEPMICLDQVSLEDHEEPDSLAPYASSPCFMHEFNCCGISADGTQV